MRPDGDSLHYPRPRRHKKYPNNVVRIIVPFAAGGGTDVLARSVAQGLSEKWGSQVIIDNRPGAGSSTGTDAVAKAAPDGYTLLYTSPAYAINPALYKKLPFAQDDLVPDRDRRGRAAGARDASLRSSQDRARADRIAQGEPRKVQLRDFG